MAKISWIFAKKYYISDERISYVKVVEKFGVSETAVKNRSRREDWRDLRTKTLLKVD